MCESRAKQSLAPRDSKGRGKKFCSLPGERRKRVKNLHTPVCAFIKFSRSFSSLATPPFRQPNRLTGSGSSENWAELRWNQTIGFCVSLTDQLDIGFFFGSSGKLRACTARAICRTVRPTIVCQENRKCPIRLMATCAPTCFSRSLRLLANVGRKQTELGQKSMLANSI